MSKSVPRLRPAAAGFRLWGLRLLLGGLLTAAVGCFVAGRLDLHAAWTSLAEAHGGNLALSVVAMLLNVALKVLRWRWLFYPRRPGCGRLLRALMIGQLGNAMLPARLGDVARLGVVGGAEPGLAGLAVMTVVVEKAIDTLVLVLVSLALLPFLAVIPRPSVTQLALAGTLVLLLALLTLLAAWTAFRQRVVRLAGCLPLGRATGLLQRAVQSAGSLEALQRGGVHWRLWAGSLAIWLLAGLVNHFGFRAVGLELPFAAALLFAVAEIGGNAAAYGPAAIGVYHSIGVLTLSLYGVRSELALSASVLLHLVVYLPILLGGLASVWLESALRTKHAQA